MPAVSLQGLDEAYTLCVFLAVADTINMKVNKYLLFESDVNFRCFVEYNNKLAGVSNNYKGFIKDLEEHRIMYKECIKHILYIYSYIYPIAFCTPLAQSYDILGTWMV